MSSSSSHNKDSASRGKDGNIVISNKSSGGAGGGQCSRDKFGFYTNGGSGGVNSRSSGSSTKVQSINSSGET